MNCALIDLHLHIDGSLNIRWMYERALLRGIIPEDTSFSDYYDRLFPAKESGIAIFDKFDVPLAVMQCQEDIHDACYTLVKELAEEGLLYAELRFGPQLHTRNGLTQEEALIAALEGIHDAMCNYPSIRVNLLNAFMHAGDSAKANEKENLETLYLTEKYLGQGVAGLDLAGYENNCDLNEYASLFQLAREKDIPFTIHAGEMGNGENVLKAIDMGAKRLGHGIFAIQDPSYIKAILDNDVTLEICVTSNRSFGFTYATHPIRQLMDKGIKVTVNTDDGMFDLNNLAYEHFVLKKIGFSEEELLQCTMNAVDAAFLSEKEKNELRQKIIKPVSMLQ
ncbi:MAG: adenosine deaminase [Erysipelotrichaceae bacterium]|nr:adenosine deaminase [Erysipelotrichaceae bacterium]